MEKEKNLLNELIFIFSICISSYMIYSMTSNHKFLIKITHLIKG